jgi:hypothetical protein
LRIVAGTGKNIPTLLLVTKRPHGGAKGPGRAADQGGKLRA